MEMWESSLPKTKVMEMVTPDFWLDRIYINIHSAGWLYID